MITKRKLSDSSLLLIDKQETDVTDLAKLSSGRKIRTRSPFSDLGFSATGSGNSLRSVRPKSFGQSFGNNNHDIYKVSEIKYGRNRVLSRGKSGRLPKLERTNSLHHITDAHFKKPSADLITQNNDLLIPHVIEPSPAENNTIHLITNAHFTKPSADLNTYSNNLLLRPPEIEHPSDKMVVLKNMLGIVKTRRKSESNVYDYKEIVSTNEKELPTKNHPRLIDTDMKVENSDQQDSVSVYSLNFLYESNNNVENTEIAEADKTWPVKDTRDSGESKNINVSDINKNKPVKIDSANDGKISTVFNINNKSRFMKMLEDNKHILKHNNVDIDSHITNNENNRGESDDLPINLEHIVFTPYSLTPKYLQKYVNRLTHRISAESYVDICKVYRRSIEKLNEKEEIMQLAFEHDIALIAKNIVNKTIDKIEKRSARNKKIEKCFSRLKKIGKKDFQNVIDLEPITGSYDHFERPSVHLRRSIEKLNNDFSNFSCSLKSICQFIFKNQFSEVPAKVQLDERKLSNTYKHLENELNHISNHMDIELLQNGKFKFTEDESSNGKMHKGARNWWTEGFMIS